MLTQDEITKLAREYVEQSAEEVGTKLDPESWAFDCMMTQAKDVINFLLRTHCIVSKEKVRKMHNGELEFAQFYQRKANSCRNQQCRIDYETSRDIAKSRASLLESLFDAETFKNSEV